MPHTLTGGTGWPPSWMCPPATPCSLVAPGRGLNSTEASSGGSHQTLSSLRKRESNASTWPGAIITRADRSHRATDVTFFCVSSIKSLAPEVTSSNKGLLKAGHFSHRFQEFLLLGHSTAMRTVFLEAQELPCVCPRWRDTMHATHGSSSGCSSAT